MHSEDVQEPPLRGREVRRSKLTEKRRDAICLISLCALALLTWLPRIQGPIDLRWDAGVYYVLGTSLAEGKGYRLLNEPRNIEAIQYPPGLPAIVAGHQLAFGTSDPLTIGISLRRTWLFLSLVYACLTFLLARLFLPVGFAFFASTASVLNYQMMFLSTFCYAELPFATSSLLFAYFLLRPKQNIFTRLIAAVSALTTYWLRSVGLVLLIAWIAEAALKRQYKQTAIRVMVAILPVLFWQGYVRNVQHSWEYQHPAYSYQRDPSMFYNVSYATNVGLTSPFEPEKGRATKLDLLSRAAKNSLLMPKSLAEAVTASEGLWNGNLKKIGWLFGQSTVAGWVQYLILTIIGLPVLCAVLWQLWKRNWVIGIYLGLTIAAICTTPWPGQFSRYLAPVGSFLLITTITFLLALAKTTEGTRFCRARKVILWTFLGIVMGESIISCVSGYRNFLDYAEYTDHQGVQHRYKLMHYALLAGSTDGLLWLQQHATADAIVAVSMPQWLYLKTGLKAVMPPFELDAAKAEQLVDEVPVDYVVLDRLLVDSIFNNHFAEIVRSAPDKWQHVYWSPDHQFDIYRRVGSHKIASNPPDQMHNRLRF